MRRINLGVLLLAGFSTVAAWAEESGPLIRSARTGRWSDRATWEAGRAPGPLARVQVRTGHVVTYDTMTTDPIRSIHVAGTLRFDPEQDTRLDVGLIKIQAGDDPGESGFDCEGHVQAPAAGAERAALEVGTADHPIAAGHTALDPPGGRQWARSRKLPGDRLLRRPDGFPRCFSQPLVGQAGVDRARGRRP